MAGLSHAERNCKRTGAPDLDFNVLEHGDGAGIPQGFKLPQKPHGADARKFLQPLFDERLVGIQS